MREPSSRAVALAALEEWRNGRRFADVILAERLRSIDLPPADRAFATELFFGLLRNLTLLDFWIGQLRSAHLDHDSRDLLRLGLYQLFLLQTPEHAAIYETVELATRKSRGLINGVLRNAVRGKAELLKKAEAQDLAVRLSHPQFLVDRWRRNFTAPAAEQLCEWNNRPAPVYARINHLKISDEEFLTEAGSARCVEPPLNSIPPNFVRVAHPPADALAAGHCYVQDPSTAAAC